MVHGSAFRLQRLSNLQRDEAEAAVLPQQRQRRVIDHCVERHAGTFNRCQQAHDAAGADKL